MKARPQDQRAPRPPRGPFARPLHVREVKDEPLVVAIEAKPEELAAIAEAVGLPSVRACAVRYKIMRRAGGRYDVTGDLRATIEQVCVVSLDPFVSDVTQDIDIAFAAPQTEIAIHGLDRRHRDAPRMAERAAPPVPGSDDQEDPPDPIVDDTIDLGAVALEFLTLACDLYPRKPGVAFAEAVADDADDVEPSAFAALERLKDRS